jgi:hypothetical protein
MMSAIRPSFVIACRSVVIMSSSSASGSMCRVIQPYAGDAAGRMPNVVDSVGMK